MVMILLPALLALRSEKIRTKSAKAAKRLSFLLPSTAEERRWWWLVCITAGVCEEIVYRGFLLHYLHVMPLHLTWTWALVVGAVIFGIGHLYQGIAGAVQDGGRRLPLWRAVSGDRDFAGADGAARGDGFARAGDVAGGI